MFGRVATEVNTVKIRPMGQMIWRFISIARQKRNGSRADFRFLILIFGGTYNKRTVPLLQTKKIMPKNLELGTKISTFAAEKLFNYGLKRQIGRAF